ncbi:MAG: uroporphyrinogen decarboxylase family protein [Planctomycetota bacterium]
MKIQDESVDRLIGTLLDRIADPRHQAKKNVPSPRFTTFLENLGWAQWFGYDMNRFYGESEFNLQIQLRQKLFHLDHFDDDTVVAPNVSASRGMYFEYTVVGMSVRHQPDGVPIIQDDHPLTKKPDLGLLTLHDFTTSGEMPQVFRLYEDLQRLSKDRLTVTFPTWQRGPLDMAIQLRGYEQFIMDTIERPAFVHDLMDYLIEERMRWWDAYCKHFGKTDRTAGISDDWINVPFITPAMFEDFVLPYYLELEKYHGKIVNVHSCGNKVPVQKMLLRLKTLPAHEVNHWTDLEATCRNIPPDKHLYISILNTEVLLADEEKMERDLRRIVALCRGRSYNVVAQAIEKVNDDMADDIAQVERWIAVAKRVFGRPTPQ